MPVSTRLLAPALAAGLLFAVLTGCGGAAKPPAATPAASHSAAPAQPAVPTTAAAIQGHLYSVANGATSVQVKGQYTYPRIKITVNVGLRQPGQIAGLIVDNGLRMSVIDVGGTMYAKITPAFAAYYHQSASCPALCGKYTALPRSFAHSLVRSLGVTSTLDVLLSMSQNLAKPTTTTYQGQPALKALASGYGSGAYVIFSATAQTYPLKAVDPGHFDLTFSKWNSVPAVHAPPKSKIHTVPL